ncbi:MAG TPA: transposase family protein [Chlamydiales bacterium]|nr:transposase family protein [Chlamydiales bacterium]
MSPVYVYHIFVVIKAHYMIRPKNPKELFNLRHSQCRNVIEQIFGVVKSRFKMFREPNDFPIHTQGQIASAICILHNFIRIHDPNDMDEDEESTQQENGGREHGISRDTSQIRGISRRELQEAEKHRDNMANAMWQQYQVYLAQHNTRSHK